MLLGKLFAVSRNWLVSPGSAIGVKTPEHKENKKECIIQNTPANAVVIFSPVLLYGCESWTIKKAKC